MRKKQRKRATKKVLRFTQSERILHWSIAVPFLVCYFTALVLVVYYNPDPSRPYRWLFSWIHRGSGVCLIVFPLLALARAIPDYRVHLYNIASSWRWTANDFKWLALMGPAAIFKKIKLPPQDKFNAAEKINFLVLMVTYPLYIGTGLYIWQNDAAFFAWVLHFGMALFASPLLFGHIYMATINPGSRVGLKGMISGFVDAEWAYHHYTNWFIEQFGKAALAGKPSSMEDEDYEYVQMSLSSAQVEMLEELAKRISLQTGTKTDVHSVMHLLVKYGIPIMEKEVSSSTDTTNNK